MTTEEIINTLKTAQVEVEWYYPIEYAAAIDEAIEALEKQIPMKPLPEEMDVFGKIIKPCGFCGDDPGEGYFCQWCGQRIEK